MLIGLNTLKPHKIKVPKGTAIMTVSLADGILPRKELEAKKPKRVVVFLDHEDQVTDPELFELVEMECRDMLTDLDYPGSSIPFVIGSSAKADESLINKIKGMLDENQSQ